MKHLRTVAVLLTVACICISNTSLAKDAMVRDVRKGGQDDRGEGTSLDVNITFSSNAGQTITDEDGTTYCFYGYRQWEKKIYPSEYWGVFPMYFFGQRVGINVDVKNQSKSDDAKLKITTECYCLKTDGGNGAQLLAPNEREVVIAADSTTSFDGSFVGEFVEGAESGLDRFLVKIYEAGNVTYQVVRDEVNQIKYEDAAPGLGEDGAKQIDTFVIGVTDAITTSGGIPAGGGLPGLPGTETLSVVVDTKAGKDSCKTTLSGAGSTATDELGFKLTLLATALDDSAVISIESVSNRHALSHVEFTFIDGAEVKTPAEGSRSVMRDTLQGEDSALIMVKEGVFCPPELDEEMTETLDAILGE